jgi:hypothetical protein
MAVRDRTAEIVEIKRRGPKTVPGLHYEFETLRKQWLRMQGTDDTTADFYPIRAVTLLEVFSGAWIAQIVDHGMPYIEKVVELKTDLKFDLALVRAIHGRTITLGDMVAHSLSFRSFGQVCGCFSALLGRDLISSISDAVDRRMTLGQLLRPSHMSNTTPKPIITDVGEMRRVLSRLFVVRHILVHEFPQKEVYDRDEITVFLRSAEQFAHATDETLSHLLFGDVPITMQGMKEQSRRALDESEAELARIAERVRSKADRRKMTLLKKSEKAWLTFRQAACDVRADLARGGTLAGYLALLEANTLTKSRIDQLKKYLEEEED